MAFGTSRALLETGERAFAVANSHLSSCQTQCESSESTQLGKERKLTCYLYKSKGDREMDRRSENQRPPMDGNSDFEGTTKMMSKSAAQSIKNHRQNFWREAYAATTQSDSLRHQFHLHQYVSLHHGRQDHGRCRFRKQSVFSGTLWSQVRKMECICWRDAMDKRGQCVNKNGKHAFGIIRALMEL